MKNSPLILAIDTDSLETAQEWVTATSEFIGTYKVGLEFFLKFGADGLRRIQDQSQRQIFLDLKLHDIPNTVAGAVRSVADIAPRFLTVHASGGAEMIRRAVSEAGDTEISAVTILTSLTQEDVSLMGFADDITSVAAGLASISAGAGAQAIVCSPHEIRAIREVVGPDLHIITPGVRLASLDDDQKRTMTPREAIDAGANFLVIGRPITGEWKNGSGAMRSAAEAIALSLNS